MPPLSLPALPAELLQIVNLARQASSDAAGQLGRATRQVKSHAFTADEAVTAHDRQVQDRIIAALQQWFPQDGMIGEESADGNGITNIPPKSGDRVWVIDPLDGTNNFVSGFAAVGVCIGRLDKGMPAMGVVHDISRHETWCGQQGAGAWRIVQDQAIPVLAPTTPLDASSIVMLTSNLLDSHGQIPPVVLGWLTRAPWKARMIGSAAIEAALVGGGIAHAAYSPNAKLWDLVAAAGVVLAAGGVVTAPHGQQIFPFDTSSYRGAKVPFLVGGPQAHRTLSEELAKGQ